MAGFAGGAPLGGGRKASIFVVRLRGSQNRSWRAFGAEKIIGNFQEASGGILGRDFTPPGGPGGRFGLHFGGSQGSFWLSFWRLVLNMRKSKNLQTLHTKALIFRVPEPSRGSFLEPKTSRKTTWEPRARRSTLGASKNRSPSALGEPPGFQKILVTSKCAQEEFPGHFSPKWAPPGSSRGSLPGAPGASSGPMALPEAPRGAPGAIFERPEQLFRTMLF